MTYKDTKKKQFNFNSHFVFVDDQGGDGIPIIFQHGLGGDSKQTKNIFPIDTCWRLITMECQGHGKTPLQNKKKISINAFAEDLNRLIEHYNAPLVIGGISMGAAISLKVAVEYPENVLALILVRPAWISDSKPKNLSISRLVAQLLKTNSPSSAYAKFLQNKQILNLKQDSPDNFLTFKSMFFRKDYKNFADILGTISADGPNVTEKQIMKITAPTLILATEKDIIHPINYAYSLKNMIKDSTFTKITSKSDNTFNYVEETKNSIKIFLNKL